MHILLFEGSILRAVGLKCEVRSATQARSDLTVFSENICCASFLLERCRLFALENKTATHKPNGRDILSWYIMVVDAISGTPKIKTTMKGANQNVFSDRK